MNDSLDLFPVSVTRVLEILQEGSNGVGDSGQTRNLMPYDGNTSACSASEKNDWVNFYVNMYDSLFIKS